jgi:hypothetical protein
MSGLFGGGKSAPPPPPPVAPAPAVIPTIDSSEVDKARKRAVREAQERGGRASTILTSKTDDKLG